MVLQHSKNIFIAYSEKDREIAGSLREALLQLFGNDIWMRDFDLDSGSLVVEALTDAAAEAKWFIILLSQSSTESQWLKTEADLATFRAIEDLEVKIIA